MSDDQPGITTAINSSTHAVQDISPNDSNRQSSNSKNLDRFLDDFLRDCYQEQIDYELSQPEFLDFFAQDDAELLLLEGQSTRKAFKEKSEKMVPAIRPIDFKEVKMNRTKSANLPGDDWTVVNPQQYASQLDVFQQNLKDKQIYTQKEIDQHQKKTKKGKKDCFTNQLNSQVVQSRIKSNIWFTYLAEQIKILWEKQYLVAIQVEENQPEQEAANPYKRPAQTNPGIDILQVKYQILSNFMRAVTQLTEQDGFLDVDKNNKYRAGLFYLNQQLKVREDLDEEKKKYLEKKEKNHGLFCRIKRGLKDDHHHHHHTHEREISKSVSYAEHSGKSDLELMKNNHAANYDQNVLKLQSETQKTVQERLLDEIKYTLKQPQNPLFMVL